MSAKRARSAGTAAGSVTLGVFATAWSAIVSIFAVRWYVELLGIESYGLIGFFVTLQAALAVFELGLGATVNREVARSAALANFDHARRLLYSLEFVYAGVAIIIAASVWLAAPWIAEFWLGSSTLPNGDIEESLRLMGLIAALRWPIGLYQGALIGLQRAQIAYWMNATIATLANGGAVLILLYVDNSLWGFFIWQVGVALLMVAWARRSAWQELGQTIAARYDSQLLRTVLLKSAMMSGVAASGLLLAQMDKLAVSSFTPLAEFARYALATVMAGGLSILILPTFNVIYPRLSAFFVTGDQAGQIAFYRAGTRLFLSCMAPVALSAYFYSNELLLVWTGDAELAAATAPIAGLLCLGSALNGLMHFPYALQLAAGKTKLAFLTNCGMITVMVPLALFLVTNFGALGGAKAWLALNGIYFFVGVIVTHVYLLPALHKLWVPFDVVPSLVVAGAFVGAGDILVSMIGPEPFVRLLLATLVSLVTTAILLMIFRDTHPLVANAWSVAKATFAGKTTGQGPSV